MKLPQAAEFTFSQDNDSCDSDSLGQYLAVKIEDAGGGPYLVLKTDRWALDAEDLPAFVERLQWCLAQVRSVFDEPSGPSSPLR